MAESKIKCECPAVFKLNQRIGSIAVGLGNEISMYPTMLASEFFAEVVRQINKNRAPKGVRWPKFKPGYAAYKAARPGWGQGFWHKTGYLLHTFESMATQLRAYASGEKAFAFHGEETDDFAFLQPSPLFSTFRKGDYHITVKVPEFRDSRGRSSEGVTQLGEGTFEGKKITVDNRAYLVEHGTKRTAGPRPLLRPIFDDMKARLQSGNLNGMIPYNKALIRSLYKQWVALGRP